MRFRRVRYHKSASCQISIIDNIFSSKTTSSGLLLLQSWKNPRLPGGTATSSDCVASFVKATAAEAHLVISITSCLGKCPVGNIQTILWICTSPTSKGLITNAKGPFSMSSIACVITSAGLMTRPLSLGTIFASRLSRSSTTSLAKTRKICKIGKRCSKSSVYPSQLLSAKHTQ